LGHRAREPSPGKTIRSLPFTVLDRFDETASLEPCDGSEQRAGANMAIQRPDLVKDPRGGQWAGCQCDQDPHGGLAKPPEGNVCGLSRHGFSEREIYRNT
jgi:hypothetical protein